MSIRDTAGQREVPRLKGPYGDGPGEDSATSGPGDGRGPPAATQGQRGVSARLNLGGTTKCLKRSRPNHRGRERVFVPRSPSPPERRSSISRAPRRKPRRKHSSRPAAPADSAASQMSSASWGGGDWGASRFSSGPVLCLRPLGWPRTPDGACLLLWAHRPHRLRSPPAWPRAGQRLHTVFHISAPLCQPPKSSILNYF